VGTKEEFAEIHEAVMATSGRCGRTGKLEFQARARFMTVFPKCRLSAAC
jgi:hypothetical protein